MISIQALNVGYEDGNKIFAGIDLHIQSGESVAIMGHNGSGKSTLLNVLCGLLMPQSGVVTIDGVLLEHKNIQQIRQKVGMVFQNPENQLFMPTIFEDIAFGLRNQGVGEDDIKNKVLELSARLGIEDVLYKNAFQLSGGEKRTVALACVLVMNPQIILFDEPTAFLDLRTRKIFIKMLKDISCTKLIVTHDFDFACKVCNKAIVLDGGRIVYQGGCNELNIEICE